MNKDQRLAVIVGSAVAMVMGLGVAASEDLAYPVCDRITPQTDRLLNGVNDFDAHRLICCPMSRERDRGFRDVVDPVCPCRCTCSAARGSGKGVSAIMGTRRMVDQSSEDRCATGGQRWSRRPSPFTEQPMRPQRCR
jgi:hypothetical protein